MDGHATAIRRRPSATRRAALVVRVVGLLTGTAWLAGCVAPVRSASGAVPGTTSPAPAARTVAARPVDPGSPTPTRTPPAAPRPPAMPRPTPLHTPAPPPARLPPVPSRAAVQGWTCDQMVQAINGSAARCAEPGDPVLRAETVVDGESTVGLTDEQQVVHVERGMSTEDTYLVAMHERGHQELRQRCDTWTCGDALARAMGSSRGAWNDGPYFARVVEAGASTWAHCHGADNPRYGYRLSCEDLEAAFGAEVTARRAHALDQQAYDLAWARYREDYERYRREYDLYAAQP